MVRVTLANRFAIKGARRRMGVLATALMIGLFYQPARLSAQPQPGDIFRDYAWAMPDSFAQPFLRVIGDGDYREPVGMREMYPEGMVEAGWITLPHAVDLERAVRAEFQVERLLSHDGTTGLAVRLNDRAWHPFPMPEAVPEPKANYLQHNYPLVEVPLDELRSGPGNRVRFRVDSVQRFGMPQNILYGFRLRVYYDSAKARPGGLLRGVADGERIDGPRFLSLDAATGPIEAVHYLGLFRDVNWAGDGRARQWHYTFYRGNLRNHIGTAAEAPYRIEWDPGWLPDQPLPMQVSAWVRDTSGLTFFLPPVTGLRLDRDYSVELVLPHRIPEMWATREQVFAEELLVAGDVRQAEAAQLAFVSWSPGYLNGIYLNDWLLPTFDACNYCYGEHRIEVPHLYALRPGLNTIRTGLTPRVRGQMVHGTEIQFPGIMLLVRYPTPPVRITEVEHIGTPHFRVETPAATYYIERRSGGCSSLIDPEGRDWVAFRQTGNDNPTNSADSDYRGIPNLVFREPGAGVGHPGFAVASTEQVGEDELLVRSDNGRWQFRWVFHPRHAEIRVERVDTSRAYWFLYEGPVGGAFDPGSQYWGTDVDGRRSDRPSIFQDPVGGYWQWAFFGDRRLDRALFVAQAEPDDAPDYFAYMGNDAEAGNLSADGMNVFGFGRGLQTNPELRGPRRFLLGFVPTAIDSPSTERALEQYIRQLIAE